MEIKVNKGEKNTYKVDINVPADIVKERLDEALHHEAEEMEIKGFRKGKAPIELVKEKVDQSKLRGHMLNHLLPDLYARIITENKLRPIIDPKLEILQFEEGKDLVLRMTLIEKPQIELKDYKAALKERYKSKNEKPESEASSEEKKTPVDLTNEEVVEVIVDNSQVDLADELVKEETDRMISNMIDQINRMGITLEQYLETVKKTAEQIREEYAKTAQKTLHADFAITEISFKEDLKVTDEEVEKSINDVPDEKTRELLSSPEQRMYVKAILTKAKTLEKLAEMAKNIESN